MNKYYERLLEGLLENCWRESLDKKEAKLLADRCAVNLADEYIYFSGTIGKKYEPQDKDDEYLCGDTWVRIFAPAVDFCRVTAYRRKRSVQMSREGWVSSEERVPGFHQSVEVRDIGICFIAPYEPGIWVSEDKNIRRKYHFALHTYWREINCHG